MAGRRFRARPKGATVGTNGKVIHVAPHQSSFGYSLKRGMCGAVPDAANSVVLSLRLTTCAKCRELHLENRRVALTEAGKLRVRPLVPRPMFIDGAWYSMAVKP